ncbi:MAG: macro domain-containing protein, partial [Clostridia bacterium]|nr:macro domain-containing protein [Clostridia bacterium]
MMQSERRLFLLEQLIALKTSNSTPKQDIQIPKNMGLQRQLLRTLMNEFDLKHFSQQFKIVHDEYLSTLIKEKGITDVSHLTELKQDLYLWKGDITTLMCDAIVCPTDSKLNGLLYPQKNKIDNSIHAFAGMKLKADCDKLLGKFDKQVPMSQSVMTCAYNLPSKWILHTVCPTIKKQLSEQDSIDFANCHKNCLI